VVLITVAVNCCGSVRVRGALAGCTVTPTAAKAFKCKQNWIKRKRSPRVRPNFINSPIIEDQVCFSWNAAPHRKMAAGAEIHAIFIFF
jgi:hypothetical protein